MNQYRSDVHGADSWHVGFIARLLFVLLVGEFGGRRLVFAGEL
jgi:hypothetical protein